MFMYFHCVTIIQNHEPTMDGSSHFRKVKMTIRLLFITDKNALTVENITSFNIFILVI